MGWKELRRLACRGWYGDKGSSDDQGSDTQETEDLGHSPKNGTLGKKLRTYTGNTGCSTGQEQSSGKGSERGIGLDQNYIQGQRSLAGYGPKGREELDVTEWLSRHACRTTLYLNSRKRAGDLSRSPFLSFLNCWWFPLFSPKSSTND